jgi:tetratricopeptide (TPR) repeat protein
MSAKNMIIGVLVFAFVAYSYAQSSMADEAQRLFAKREYLNGMNILTKAMNSPDPTEKARAQQTYAAFYEDTVGNFDYALTFYNEILRSSLPEDNPTKLAALKAVSRLKLWKIQYRAEDLLLKKIKPAESANENERKTQVAQLQSIIQQKPEYYRLSEVYYQLGRHYFAAGDYSGACAALKKSLELKPGVNFYLPVNVWADMAYGKWIRARIHLLSWAVLGGLLILTAIAFYAARPWRWLKFRHLLTGLLVIVLWLAVFGISYVWLTAGAPASQKTMFESGVVPPYFFSLGPDGPFWMVTRNLFVYGLVGVLGVFVFSIGLSRIKHRWLASVINLVFAVLLFTALTTVFYMRNCDHKSMFGSDAAGSAAYYLGGDNYFVSFGMEPYVLTNPKAYPNLALNNLSDPYLLEWVKKHCPFPPQSNKPEH